MRLCVMGKRRPRPYEHYHYTRPDLFPRELDQRSWRNEKILAVKVYLPRPVAKMARREVYTYPYPQQIQKRWRVARYLLRSSKKHKFVPVTVRIRVPKRLPLVRASYVSIRNNMLNVHSYHQTRREYERNLNTRRYSEHKGNRRKARYGQLDSPGATAFGAVAEASRRGWSIDRIADSALGARALLGRPVRSGW